MALILWEQADLEAEISAETCLQILDDDNDGVIDADVLAQLQRRSAARVLASLQRVYPGLIALADEWQADLTLVPQRLKDLALDVAVAHCSKRHPEHVRRDWRKMIEHVEADLDRIRKAGLDSLGIETAPEPAANQGGTLGEIGSTASVNPGCGLIFSGPCDLGDF